MSLFGLFKPSVGRLRDNGDIRGLVQALDYRDAEVRAEATRALGRIGAPAVEPLVNALSHEFIDVRMAAVKALVQVGDAQAMEPLIAVLSR